MVKLTVSLLKKLSKHGNFIDSLRIHLKAGNGGHGLSKYGGTGGRGGSIYAEGSPEATLKKIRKENPELRFKAGIGANSSRRSLFADPGEDKVIPVPLGVEIKTDSRLALGEVNAEGDRVLVACGGDGGSPMNSFLPQPGQSYSVRLDLKLIADVGLVGFPNAGKSTLLKALSKAVPKVAAYPFTTLRPQLGVMMYPDKRQISMADLPGLIEGAHVNVGMGHNFLKHVERTKLLLFVIDVCGFRLGPKYPMRTAAETVLLLNRELELYKPELTDKPAILALNKIDIPGGEDLADQTEHQIQEIQELLQNVDKSLVPEHLVKFDKVFKISAKDRVNTDNVKESVRTLLDIYADKEQQAELMEVQTKNRTELQNQLTEHYKRMLV